MKKLFILIMAAFCILAANASTIDKAYNYIGNEALRYIKAALGDRADDADYYVAQAVINPKDLSFVTTASVSPNYYVFYVDEEPQKGWEHDCSYFFVPLDYDGLKPLGNQMTRKQFKAPQDYPVSFEQINKKNRYKNPNLKIKLEKSNGAAETNSHIYSVIISGGINKYSNHERYWNDCSYIFQVLKNKYGIPDDNISVLMSDGTNPAADMRKADNTGYVSSPLDLDGDGVDDIKYAASKENITAVLKRLSAKLTSKDQLFIYVIDHGGHDANGSYICLWNNESLYASELSSLLDKLKTPFVNVILGQCFSGGFIAHLEKPGRTIATACAENESSWSCGDIPYDEFVFQWTNAVNEMHGVTQAKIYSDINGNGHISMEEAFNYACENDRRNDLETPGFSSLNQATAEELSLDNVPSVYGLYIKDDPNDTGYEPNSVRNFWWTSDIWVRNQDDGLVNQCSEPIKVGANETEKDVYIYIKVHNRGIEDYKKDSREIFYHLYFANASLGILPQNWLGLKSSVDDHVFGDKIVSNTITADIPHGGYGIIKKKWTIPDDMMYELHNGYLHFCLLGRLSNSRGEEFDKEKELLKYISNVRGSNRLAQKNLSFILSSDKNSNDIPLKLRSLTETERPYDIELIAERGSENLFNRAEVSVSLSDEMYRQWETNGKNGVNLVAYNNAPKTLYMVNHSSINSVMLEKTDAINISCNFLSNNITFRTDTFMIHIVQRDTETGEIVGGEAVCILNEPRNATIEPIISDKPFELLTRRLEASNVNEPATYEWFDSERNLIGKGKDLFVPAGVEGEITLRVKADEDGQIGYAKTFVEKGMSIKSLSPLPFKSSLNVTLSSPATLNTALKIAPAYGTGEVLEYPIAKGENGITVYVSQLCKGIYTVSLLENGIVVDTEKVIKE